MSRRWSRPVAVTAREESAHRSRFGLEPPTGDVWGIRKDPTSPPSVPLCLESPLAALDPPITPTAEHFVRSHFPPPRIDRAAWSLEIRGLVNRPRRWKYDDL